MQTLFGDKQADAEGELHKDVFLGDYIRPWNADEKTKGIRRGIPKSQYWAYEDTGIDQVRSSVLTYPIIRTWQNGKAF